MPDLEDLLVDVQTFDRAAITAALIDVVAIGRDGTLRPQEAWESLSRRARVIAVLLALRAAAALEVRSSDSATPSQVADMTGLPGGTVRPILRQLVSSRVASGDARGAYRVTPMAVRAAVAALVLERGRRG